MKALGKRSLASFLKLAIDVVYFLSFAAGVLLVGITVVLPFIHESTHLTVHPRVLLEFDPDFFEVLPGTEGSPRVAVEQAWAELEVEGVSAGRMAFGLAFAWVFLGFLILSLRQLRHLLRTLRDGDPFVPANAGRIRFLGFAVLAFELVYRGAIFWMYFPFVMNQFGIRGLALRPLFEPNLVVIFAGLVLLVIAEVFRLGSDLQREQELTV